jgi:hypothetical protein
MRIGIIANSFSPAFRIYEHLQGLLNYEVFILLSPSPARSAWLSTLANAARLTIVSISAPLWRNSNSSFRSRVVFFLKPLDNPSSIVRLKALNLDIGLHKSGIIYRKATIDAFRLGILNPHIGILPAYRGRNVMEWSLLQGDPTGISVFFVDSGIDTGERIVHSEQVDVSNFGSAAEAKRFLFGLDGKFFRKALELLQSENPVYTTNDGSGRRYYVMSKLFSEVVEDLLKRQN